MDKVDVILSFENYDFSNAVEINKICSEIKKKRGMVSLAGFNKTRFLPKEVMDMDVDFVEYDFNEKTDIETLIQLVEKCKEDTKRVIGENINHKSNFFETNLRYFTYY